MPDIELISLDFHRSQGEIEASFSLEVKEANDNTIAALHREPRARLSVEVFFPDDAADDWQTGAYREAHQQLREHLEALVKELQEILQPPS